MPVYAFRWALGGLILSVAFRFDAPRRKGVTVAH